MFIKGKCAIYIDKNLRVYENSTVIFVLWFQLTAPFNSMLPQIVNQKNLEPVCIRDVCVLKR